MSLGDVRVDGDDVYWIEGRASEGGRQVLVRHGHGDVTGPDVNVRSDVYVYGGTPYAVRDGRIVHVGETGPLFADFFIAADGDVLAVRERGDTHDIVALPDRQIAAGHDFFSAPRRSDDGRTAWMTWDHPNMPWDSSSIWLDGELVDGGPEISAGQPRFGPDGALHYACDRTGWWNLYREGQPIAELDAEFSGPDWEVGQSTYAWLADGTLVATWVRDGLDHVGYVRDGVLHEVETPYTYFKSIQGQGDKIVCIAGSAAAPNAVVRIGLDGAVEVLHASRELPCDPAYVSQPRPVGKALYYPPHNPEFEAPEGERPPVIVTAHGGPTGRYTSELNLDVQFWTTRGIGVLQVNYRGSTGYGRAYRDELRGNWGIYDVEDCVAAVEQLGDAVDRSRAAIRGGSAGGYTVLRALTTTDAFAAGISRFGVADLKGLARDTHKLESRYLDSLIGGPERYDERSPLADAARLNTPTLLLQGLDDKVVPPAQSEVIRDAMAARGVPHAYIAFEGEGHGFRKAESIRKAELAELIFLGGVLGFEPDNLPHPVSELNLILIGPPGAGKGTQAENLQADFGLPYIATGDLMRAKRQEDSELGREIARIIAAGDLVPDEIVCKALFEKVDEEGDDGFLLDGFPRTTGQADTLDEALTSRGRELTAVLYIDVPHETIIQRLAGRRVCSKNNAHVYHVDCNKPKHEGVCDIDGAKLIQRDDDKPETIENRLATYDRETKPLLSRYEEAGLLRTFDGTRSPDEVHRHIRATLATLKLEERL